MGEASDPSSNLRGKFPALLRLEGASRARKVPFVQQMEASDCGAACLAMVLGLHGRRVSLEETRRVTGSGRGGVTADSILQAAARFDLIGRGVRLEPEELGFLPTGAILHWGFNHFVVFDRSTRQGVKIVDPASGPRLIPHERFREQFTGVALVLEPGDAFETGGVTQGGLWSHWEKIRAHTGGLVQVVVISLMVQLFALALPMLTGVLVDQIVPHEDLGLLRVLALGLLAVVVFHFLATLIRSHILLHLRTQLDTRLSLGFMDHLVSLPYSFFLERPTGDLLVRYHSNQRVREILTSAALSTLFDGMLVSLYMIVLLIASPAIAALTLGLGLVHVATFLVTRRRHRELANRDLEVRSRSHSSLVELISGMETLKSLGAERRSVERWSHRFVDELNVSLAQGRLAAWSGALRISLNMASPLLILLFGGSLVIQGSLSLGMMLALNALAVGFLVPLSNLVGTGFELLEVGSHLERIADVTNTPREQEGEVGTPITDLRGEIVLDKVSFRYGADQPNALEGISQRLEAGQKIAIVGRSGAGKSTLARLIVGLYRPHSGQITYDGVDLDGIDLQSVRSRIGVVTQDTQLFGTTIRNNVSLGDPAIGQEVVVAACRQAEIHDEILELPLGYDLLLADRGASLSGGQRQRIALARALARQPAILLLDEATSDLDALTETRIMANLDALNCTRIVIAHRLNTIVDAEVILVLEKGRLVETGSHAELLSRSGTYAELFAVQAHLKEGSRRE